MGVLWFLPSWVQQVQIEESRSSERIWGNLAIKAEIVSGEIVKMKILHIASPRMSFISAVISARPCFDSTPDVWISYILWSPSSLLRSVLVLSRWYCPLLTIFSSHALCIQERIEEGGPTIRTVSPDLHSSSICAPPNSTVLQFQYWPMHTYRMW